MSQLKQRVMWLMGSNVLSQLLMLVLMPIITRLARQEEYGIYSMALAAISIGSAIFTLRMELAIPKEKSSEGALVALASGLVSSVLLTLIVCPVFYLFWYVLSTPKVINIHLGIMVAVSTILMSTLTLGRYWATRIEQERISASALISRALVMLSMQILLLQLGLGSTGLIAGQLLGLVVAVLLLSRSIPLKPFLSSFKFKKIRRSLEQNKDFLRYSTPALMVSLAGTQLPVFLVAHFFGVAISGGFALVIQVLAVPSALIGQAIGMVFFREVSKKIHRNERVDKIVVKLAGTLAGVSIPAFLWLAFNAKNVFPWVFGHQWNNVAPIVISLTPWFIFSLVSSPLSPLPVAMDRQKTAMYFTIYESVLRLIMLIVGAFVWGQGVAFWGYGVSGAIICAVYLFWIFRLAGVSIKDIGSFAFKNILLAFLLITNTAQMRLLAWMVIIGE